MANISEFIPLVEKLLGQFGVEVLLNFLLNFFVFKKCLSQLLKIDSVVGRNETAVEGCDEFFGIVLFVK